MHASLVTPAKVWPDCFLVKTVVSLTSGLNTLYKKFYFSIKVDTQCYLIFTSGVQNSG